MWPSGPAANSTAGAPPALGGHQTGFTIGEVLAHLHFLIGQDRIDRLTAEDGTSRYYAVR